MDTGCPIPSGDVYSSCTAHYGSSACTIAHRLADSTNGDRWQSGNGSLNCRCSRIGMGSGRGKQILLPMSLLGLDPPDILLMFSVGCSACSMVVEVGGISLGLSCYYHTYGYCYLEYQRPS